MPATQTLHTISHDQAVVIPPLSHQLPLLRIVSRMDRLERRIKQMRDPDEMISWDDPDDVLVATLPIGFRMPDIERYTGVGWSSRRRTWEDLAQEFLRRYSFSGDTSVTRGELEFLRQGSDEPVSSFIFRWREEVAEMIEQPTERDQMSMFLRSLHPRYYSFPDTEGKGIGGLSKSYGGVCSADFQHRRPSYHPYARSLQIPRSDFPPLQHHHPHSIQHYPSMHSHTITVRPSFRFSVHRLVSHVPLALGHPEHLTFAFRAHEFCAFHQMAGHRTDYCASLRHTIQDLIDSGAVSFPVSTIDTGLGPDMTADSIPAYSTHAVPPPSGFTIMFETPSALIFTRHFDMADLVSVFWDYFVIGQHIEIRLLQLRFTMLDEIAPITLTTLYEMMVDLTRRVERIELILLEYPSSSRGAPGIAMPSLLDLTSPHLLLWVPRIHDLATLSVPAAFLIHFIGYVDTTSILGIVDSGTFGHPQSDMFPIPTSAQAMHADSPSPAVPDLIDLGD
ncbi:hypothetical protein CK203_096144 [Vitis vinifera]|uniref:Retrotransposon gag domain-containing protein n=1 Tax=Vitis vinifera TaxID=29760 RepID=A0A438DV73_VITVI|nr:hypothetical protein CK203_096144 [Vitis vinifera]